MTTVWADLPNAKHIDWVFTSLLDHSSIWFAETDKQHLEWSSSVAPGDIWYLAWSEAVKRASELKRMQIRNTIWNMIKNMASQNRGEVQYDVLAALIAWDDCGYMIESNPGEIKLLATLGDQRAILMLPGCNIYKLTMPS